MRKTDYSDSRFFKWLEEQPDYGLCNPPMDGNLALNMIFDYLDIPPNPNPEHILQCNTYLVFQILMKYSKRFRKEYRAYRKEKRRKNDKIRKKCRLHL